MHIPSLLLLAFTAPTLSAPAPSSSSSSSSSLLAERFTDSTGTTHTVYTSRDLLFTPSSSPSSSLARRFNFFGSRTDDAKCGASSFVSKTSAGSPPLEHCACLRDFLRGKKGVYQVNRDAPRFERLATCGRCTFGVDTANFFGTMLGNADAADVMTTAMERFAGGGRVGAEGRMGCDNTFQTAGTDWAIFSA